MSSFFSHKAKNDVCNCNSIQNLQPVEQLGVLDDGTEIKSTFFKMKKRRPPPITICLQSGNVILATAPTVTAIYPDGTPATPSSPHFFQCVSPVYNETNTYPGSPTAASHLSAPYENNTRQYLYRSSCRQTLTNTNRMDLTALPELPGSPLPQKREIELEAPQTPTRLSLPEKPDDFTLLDSPPDLTPNSPRDMPRLREIAFGSSSSKSKQPKQDGERVTGLGFSELVDILPELSPEETKEYWIPTMEKEAVKMRQMMDELMFTTKDGAHFDIVDFLKEIHSSSASPEELAISTNMIKNRLMPLINANIERIKNDYETRLKMKDQEITGLLQFHDSQISTLAAFIRKSGSAPRSLLEDSRDPLVQDVKEILIQDVSSTHNGYKGGNSNNNDNSRITGYIHLPASEYASQETEIATLRGRIDDLESAKARVEEKLWEYREEIRLFKKDIRGYKKDERRHAREIRDKDAEIGELNEKIAQLLNHNHSHTQIHNNNNSTVTSPISTTTTTTFFSLDKELPSPPPLEGWKRVAVAEEQLAFQHHQHQQQTTTLSPSIECRKHSTAIQLAELRASSNDSTRSFSDRIRRLDVEDDEGPFFIYKADSS